MQSYLPLLIVASFLIGCTPISREEQLNYYRKQCLEYGFKAGTDPFAACIQQQDTKDRHWAQYYYNDYLFFDRSPFTRYYW